MRAVCAAIGVMVLACAAPSAATASTQWWVNGRGWGHGIGMSQYGAQGFAQRGYTGRQIIKYYFSGVTLGSRPSNARYVDVQLISGRTAATFEADSAGVKLRRGSTSYAIPQGDDIVIKVEDGAIAGYRRHDGDSTQLFSGAAGPVTISGSSVQTLFTAENGAYGHHYRGTQRIHLVGSTLSVVNHVGLEKYLYGVVPGEMPSDWHQQALRAQAIAARSYAVAGRRSGIYDLHSDTRSQMYLGKERERTSTNAAVDGTAGTVAKYGGTTISTFFCSTSGGRTAAVEDVWGGAPRAYLRSRRDPYERSPYSRWRVVYTDTRFRQAMGVGRIRRVRVAINKSRRAERVTATTASGAQVLTPSTVQSRLGLRSTWFRIEKLSIVASDRSVSAGQTIRLSGTVPSAGAQLVMRKAGQSSWTPVKNITGSWRASVAVSSTRTYRIRRSGRLGPAVTITVS